MSTTITPNEEAQLLQTIEMFEVITQSQPSDYQSLDILKEAYFKLGREKEVVETSKKIAQAYMQLGQLSSAILEYESILQRFPNDAEARKALSDIETRATNIGSPGQETDYVDRLNAAPGTKGAPGAGKLPTEVDDGRQVMHKLFVDSKLVSPSDFQTLWTTPRLDEPPQKVADPFIQLIADKQILPLDKSLKILCEKSRSSFLPIERYDVDIDLARGFSKEVCQRWCVMPFDRMSKSVLVATANPFNKYAAAELENHARSRVLWYVSPPAELAKIIKKIYR